MSWPVSHGVEESIFLVSEGNYLNKLQNNSKQQFDMAAVATLNASKATGARIDISFGKHWNHIILDELKLIKRLNSCLRLFNCWTTFQFVIQTLIRNIIFSCIISFPKYCGTRPSAFSFPIMLYFCLIF
jgi:hypothetical protein